MQGLSVHFRALKVAYHFSDDELKNLMCGFGGLRHLREAFEMRNKDKNVRIYVASGYDTLLNAGYSLTQTLNEAKKALNSARGFFSANFSFYSPVLELDGLGLDRATAMDRCFKELKGCMFLFIAETAMIESSEGVFDEYKFALRNNIGVIFENQNVRQAFIKRLKDEC